MLLWSIVFLATVLIDIFIINNFFLFGFSIGSLVAAVMAYLNLTLMWQSVGFVVSGALATFLLTPFARKLLKTTVPVNKTKEEEYIGKIIVLEEDMNDKLKVKIDGIYWTLSSNGRSFKKGSKVKITAIEGNKFIVDSAEE